jgi:hypothetical protein
MKTLRACVEVDGAWLPDFLALHPPKGGRYKVNGRLATFGAAALRYFFAMLGSRDSVRDCHSAVRSVR